MTDALAGRAIVEVLANNEKLEQALQASTRKLSTWAIGARQIVTAAVSTGGAAIGVGLAGAAALGRGLGQSMVTVGNALKSGSSIGTKGFAELAEVLKRLTPISTKVWDVTQGGIGRGVRMLGTLRALLVAAGESAKPLLNAFDGLARKSASVAWWGRAGSALRLDFKGAAAYSDALRAGREAFLAQGRGVSGAASWLNIRGGYAVTAATSLGLRVTGTLLGGAATQGARFARAMVSGGAAAASAAGLIRPMNNELARSESRLGRIASLLPRLSSIGGALRGGALRAAGIGAGILGTLTSLAGVNGSITELFSAQGFAKHAVGLDDAARKKGVSVETYSSYQSAAQIAGVTLEDAQKDPAKMAQLKAARSRAIGLGGFVTAQQVALAREGTQATAEMGIAFRAVGTALGSAVLPQLISGVRWVTGLATAVAQFAQDNPQLISQLFTIGKYFAMGATVAGALATAIGFITSPVGLVTVALGTLAAFFPTLWESAKRNFGAITSVLVEMGAFFHTVFGGIVDALAAGNLQLAADVALAGLQVAFETALDWISAKWQGVWSGLANVVDEGLTTARIKLDEWFPGFEEAFSGFMNYLQDAWTVGVNILLDVWDSAFSVLKKSLNYLRSLFDSTFDLAGANNAIDLKTTERINARSDAQGELLNKRDQERRRRSEALAQKGTAAVLRTEQQQRKEQREAAPESNKRLQNARAALDTALKAAAAARAEKDAQRAKTINQGAFNTKVAIAERDTRGAAANDIRTKEGLADLLVAFRGTAANPQKQIADNTAKMIVEAKAGNAIHARNQEHLLAMRESMDNLDKPI